MGFGIVVASVAAIDDRVRFLIAEALATDPATALTLASVRGHAVMQSAVDTLGLQNPQHAPLTLFGLAALGLTLLIFRM